LAGLLKIDKGDLKRNIEDPRFPVTSVRLEMDVAYKQMEDHKEEILDLQFGMLMSHVSAAGWGDDRMSRQFPADYGGGSRIQNGVMFNPLPRVRTGLGMSRWFIK
jgi:hypothetical protein